MFYLGSKTKALISCVVNVQLCFCICKKTGFLMKRLKCSEPYHEKTCFTEQSPNMIHVPTYNSMLCFACIKQYLDSKTNGTDQAV